MSYLMINDDLIYFEDLKAIFFDYETDNIVLFLNEKDKIKTNYNEFQNSGKLEDFLDNELLFLLEVFDNNKKETDMLLINLDYFSVESFVINNYKRKVVLFNLEIDGIIFKSLTKKNKFRTILESIAKNCLGEIN